MSRQLLRALPALLFALSLTACGSPKLEVAPLNVRPPASLLQCSDEPEVPVITVDADLADWVLNLIAAGSDCRAALNGVKKSLGNYP